MNYRILDKKEALEFTFEKAIDKKEGEIFLSAMAIFKEGNDPRWPYDNASLEIIQHRKLNPTKRSQNETDRKYNEMQAVLRTWVDKAAIQDHNFPEINEEFYPGRLWHPVLTKLNKLEKGKIAVFDYPIKTFFEEETTTEFQIIALETTDINELPDYIIREIEKDRKLIYQYAIKTHLNEFIVDKNNNLIFRFNYFIFDKKPQDFLIPGKKIAKYIDPEIHLKYKIEPYRDRQLGRIHDIAKNYISDVSGLRYPKTLVYYEEYDMEEPSIIPFLPFNKMYDNFLPHLNMLHSNLHNYEHDNKVTTNGIFVYKPKYYGNERNYQNIGICLVFNKFGYVLRLEGDYDAIKKYRSDIARDFRYRNDLPPSEEAAKYSVNGKKLKWMFYNPDNHSNSLFDEPRDYIEYEGVFHEYALMVNIHVSYYDQDLRRHRRKTVAKNVIFDLIEV